VKVSGTDTTDRTDETDRSGTVTEPAREIPVYAEVDVVVCGGGPAGVGAALAAARSGASTLTVENQICLGGMATAGMVNRLGPYHDQEKIILGGIPKEILDALVDRGQAMEPEICPVNLRAIERGLSSPYWLVFDPEGMKRVLDEKMQEAGVRVLFDTRVVEPIMDDDVIQGVIIESKSGRFAVLARQVIDATGDADVAARAGVPFRMGRDGDKLMQPFTLFFKCLKMDWRKTIRYVHEHAAELREKVKEKVGTGFILGGTDSYFHDEETYFNCLHEHGVDGTQVDDISRAAMELRRKMWANTEVLKEHVPGAEKISVITSASAMGVRESRRIVGKYTLTIDDVVSARQFDDQVYRYACFVDIHAPKGGEKPEHGGRDPGSGKSYGVPYRCLVPKKVENLLVAGRCLSATHEALASVRMMPSCMAMGQAAGTAAALAVEHGIGPRTVAPDALRERLAGAGVIL